MYYVLSGDKGKHPSIIQAYKTKRSAEKAAEKRRQAWDEVTIRFMPAGESLIDAIF